MDTRKRGTEVILVVLVAIELTIAPIVGLTSGVLAGI
jgi:hypothetical protein